MYPKRHKITIKRETALRLETHCWICDDPSLTEMTASVGPAGIRRRDLCFCRAGARTHRDLYACALVLRWYYNCSCHYHRFLARLQLGHTPNALPLLTRPVIYFLFFLIARKKDAVRACNWNGGIFGINGVVFVFNFHTIIETKGLWQ